MVAFRNIFIFAFATIAISTVFADEAIPASTAVPGDDHHSKHSQHPKNVKKRDASGLSHEKYQAVLKVYTEEGPLEEKNKKADEVAKDFSESEKKVVDLIKKFFGKRAEAISKLSDETKTILKEIKELRNKQKAAFEKIKGEDKKAANFLLFAHAPQSLHSRPTRDGDEHHHHESTGEASATTVVTSSA